MGDDITFLWVDGIDKERKVDSGERGDNFRDRALEETKRSGIRIQVKDDSSFTVIEEEVEDTGVYTKVQIDLVVIR